MKRTPPPAVFAARLRETVALQVATRSAVTGDPLETGESWATTATARALVEPLTATEAQRAGQPVSRHPHRVTIRTGALDVRAQDRLAWGDRRLYVLSAADVQARGRETVILAVANPDTDL